MCARRMEFARMLAAHFRSCFSIINFLTDAKLLQCCTIPNDFVCMLCERWCGTALCGWLLGHVGDLVGMLCEKSNEECTWCRTPSPYVHHLLLVVLCCAVLFFRCCFCCWSTPIHLNTHFEWAPATQSNCFNCWLVIKMIRGQMKKKINRKTN